MSVVAVSAAHVAAAGESAARRFVVGGAVQGVGVRPEVARLALSLGLAGVVRNTPRGVEIEVEGPAERVSVFERRLRELSPAATSHFDFSVEAIAATGRATFEIATDVDPDEPPSVEVPRDAGVCAECSADVDDPRGRRRRYPFASCTRCGPRYSVVEAMPYERRRTSMRAFVLCPACEREYRSAADRRFHAESTCCPACGPRLRCVDRNGQITADGDDALAVAAAALCTGRVVAVCGIGGYQLLCDATAAAAVGALRRRKRRPAKPLAVLIASPADAERLALLDDVERRALASPTNPIVVVRLRSDASLSADVTMGLGNVGLMLPTTPLHRLLVEDCGRPLVCTSGNLEGEPLVYEPADAERRLAGVADLWLHHDRPIVRPIDDSVVRVIAGRVVTVRAARGIAPLPLIVPQLDRVPPLVAVGGHQHAAVALTNDRQAVLGPHVGDLDDLATRERFVAQIESLQQLYRFEPAMLACDRHPDYFTTAWAAASGVRTYSVQHHHAHVVAAMVEHDLLDRRVLGVAWDGTGFGDDGTIWGGEFLDCDAVDYRRAARLRPFALPGGEAAIREPWRVAVAVTADALGPDAARRLRFPGVAERDVDRVLRLLHVPGAAPRSSSIGRLFDAAAAFALGLSYAAYDAQPAMLWEACCDLSAEGVYPYHLDAATGVVDWRPLVRGLLADLDGGVSPGIASARFHRTLADLVVDVARRNPQLPVVLAGGVFQNRRLVEEIAARFEPMNRSVFLPGLIPPGDGGLAAGQLASAVAILLREGT